MSTPVASVVFPTFNRREILLEAIAAALAQTVPVEVLVMDDGSTDGTPEAIAARFPGRVAYHRVATGRGPTFQRNRGIELARAPVVFPLDDDAVLVSPRTVAQTLAEFDDPRVGAVGMPFRNVRREGQAEQQRAPDAAHVWIEHTFVGAAHAVRRDAFLAVGGYRESLYYMGEEGDLTLRMLARGWVTRLGNADPVEHHESPHRVTARADYYGRRNDVLFVWYNVPMPEFAAHLTATVFNGLRTACVHATYPGRMLWGLAAGGAGCLRYWRERRPVPRAVYRLHRRMKKGGALPLAEMAPDLPPLAP